jgi:beta-phosphoglucomutase
MKNKEYLAIFDMDGTLFDTNKTNFLAYRDAILEITGLKIKYSNYRLFFIGRDYKKALPLLLGKISMTNINKIHLLKKKYYKKYLTHTKPNSHLIKIIENIQNVYIIALATTASKVNTFDLLNFFQLQHLFNIIVTKDDVKKLKPNPECYLKIIKLCKLKPSKTIIFEDSIIGLKAAVLTKSSVVKIAQ